MALMALKSDVLGSTVFRSVPLNCTRLCVVQEEHNAASPPDEFVGLAGRRGAVPQGGTSSSLRHIPKNYMAAK